MELDGPGLLATGCPQSQELLSSLTITNSSLLVPEKLTDRGAQVVYIYRQREPSTAEVRGCEVKPEIKL